MIRHRLQLEAEVDGVLDHLRLETVAALTRAPAGSASAFLAGASARAVGLAMARGVDCTLIDADGDEYIDLIAGIGIGSGFADAAVTPANSVRVWREPERVFVRPRGGYMCD